MCIIAIYENGTRPTADSVKTMIKNNADGAGIAWTQGGSVHAVKGLTTAAAVMDIVAGIPVGAPIVFHARIATHGGVYSGMCHPFPVSRKIAPTAAAWSSDTSAFFHNGILRSWSPSAASRLSDSAIFCADVVAPLQLLGRTRRDAILHRIATSTASKFAIIDADGHVSRLGDGWVFDGGVWYSNSSFRAPRYDVKTFGFGSSSYISRPSSTSTTKGGSKWY